MKSKELIKILLELDPTGEVEVLAGNIDILDIQREPAYWDGCYQRLMRDPSITSQYDIIGGEYVSEGDKICIDGYSLQHAIWHNPDLPVKFLDDEMNMDNYKKEIKQCRIDVRKWAEGKEKRNASWKKILEKYNEKN